LPYNGFVKSRVVSLISKTAEEKLFRCKLLLQILSSHILVLLPNVSVFEFYKFIRVIENVRRLKKMHVFNLIVFYLYQAQVIHFKVGKSMQITINYAFFYIKMS